MTSKKRLHSASSMSKKSFSSKMPRLLTRMSAFGSAATKAAQPSAVPRSPATPRTLASAAMLELQAADEGLEDAPVEFVAELAVLDAGVEVRVVVDLDDQHPVAGLLQVHPIEAVADPPGRLQSQLQHRRRHLLQRYGAALAVDVLAVGLVVVDLPVAARHEVLAGVQRLAVEHTDAPVVLGVEELLRQQQDRTLEQLARRRQQFAVVVDLDHATGEAAIGNLQHQREAQAPGHPLPVLRAFLVEDLGERHAQLPATEQVGQVDLVGAAQDRCRVVHHHQAFALGLLGEAIGVVVDPGGLADQQGVELGQACVVLASDQFDVDAEAGADPHEVGQRLRVGRRQRFVGIVQDRHVVARHPPRTRHAPGAPAETVEGSGKDILLVATQAVQHARTHSLDMPALLATELHQQDRAGKGFEQLAGQVGQRLELGMAEIQGQGEAVGGAIGRAAQRLVQGLVEAAQGQPVHRLASQFADAAQRRDHPVAAGLGQQRTVVAEAEVLVAAAQVDHLHAAAAVVARRLLEVFLDGEDFLAGRTMPGRPARARCAIPS
ncbi:hypothetical protein G039_0316595 [Pseudomonas aeruginosa VRFPA01]|nr:hypothetical protein G039_0316595 [Pseudomonas aeruginosa VRFPA01]